MKLVKAPGIFKYGGIYHQVLHVLKFENVRRTIRSARTQCINCKQPLIKGDLHLASGNSKEASGGHPVHVECAYKVLEEYRDFDSSNQLKHLITGFLNADIAEIEDVKIIDCSPESPTVEPPVVWVLDEDLDKIAARVANEIFNRLEHPIERFCEAVDKLESMLK